MKTHYTVVFDKRTSVDTVHAASFIAEELGREHFTFLIPKHVANSSFLQTSVKTIVEGNAISNAGQFLGGLAELRLLSASIKLVDSLQDGEGEIDEVKVKQVKAKVKKAPVKAPEPAPEVKPKSKPKPKAKPAPEVESSEEPMKEDSPTEE